MVAEVVSAPALPAAPVGRMLDRGLAAGPAALSASPAGRSWSTGQTTGPGSRRTEEGGGAAGVSRGCWGEGGGGEDGDGSQGVRGRSTVGLCLGGAAPANGNAAPAEPPWSPRLRTRAGGKGRWP